MSASPAYDDDGNMTGYNGAAYTWNAENRLVSVEKADKKITFLYDYMGRRVRKQVYSGTTGSWNAEPDETRVFVYDGWNLIKEIATTGDTYYVWGLDLSQSMQGAGGIGGLVCRVAGTAVRHYTYDANGNVGQLVDEAGAIVARYEYDPFGNEIRAEGDDAQNNPFRFSTKYLDAETGLYYYGFRYYVPEIGRWISRDPLEEDGGLNIYTNVLNNLVNDTDYLGLIGPHSGSAARKRAKEIREKAKKEIKERKYSSRASRMRMGMNRNIPVAIGFGGGGFAGMYVEKGLLVGVSTAVTFFPSTCELAVYRVTAGIGTAIVEGRQMTFDDMGQPFEKYGKAVSMSGAIEVAVWVGDNTPGSADARSFLGIFHTISVPLGKIENVGINPYVGDPNNRGSNWFGGTLSYGIGSGIAMVDWKYEFITGEYETSVYKLTNTPTEKCICQTIRNRLNKDGIIKLSQFIYDSNLNGAIEKLANIIQRINILRPF